MRILERYLLARFLGLFAATLIILSLAVLIAEMLLSLDEIVEVDRSAWGAAGYLALKLPADYLWVLVPVSCFVAAFATLGTLARSLELTAIKAGGLSPVTLCAPLLIAAIGISLLSFATTETFGVWATSAWQSRYRGQDKQISFRRGSFWYHSGRLVYNVRRADPETRTLEGIRIFELDDRGRLLQSIHARGAQIEEDNRWRLDDVITRRFDPGEPLAEPEFERSAVRVLELAREEDVALLNADPSGLPIAHLREYLAAQSFQGESVTRLRAHLHQRVADPFTALVLTLLALPIGMRVEQTHSLALPSVFGVAVLAAFWVVRSVAATLASGGALPPAALPWAVLGLFAALGAGALARAPR